MSACLILAIVVCFIRNKKYAPVLHVDCPPQPFSHLGFECALCRIRTIQRERLCDSGGRSMPHRAFGCQAALCCVKTEEKEKPYVNNGWILRPRSHGLRCDVVKFSATTVTVRRGSSDVEATACKHGEVHANPFFGHPLKAPTCIDLVNFALECRPVQHRVNLMYRIKIRPGYMGELGSWRYGRKLICWV